MERWKQDITLDRFAIRVLEPERVAAFYKDVFELEARNLTAEDGGHHLTDGRVPMFILPWKFSEFNGTGIEQPAMDHIGFHTADLGAFIATVDNKKAENPGLWLRAIDFNDEGRTRLPLLNRCSHAYYWLAVRHSPRRPRERRRERVKCPPTQPTR